MAGHDGYRTYRGGKNFDYKAMTSGIHSGIGHKAFGRPTPIKYTLDKLANEHASEPIVITPADPAKVEAWKTNKNNKAVQKQDIANYTKYREKWESGGKKYPLLPFKKWREMKYGDDA